MTTEGDCTKRRERFARWKRLAAKAGPARTLAVASLMPLALAGTALPASFAHAATAHPKPPGRYLEITTRLRPGCLPGFRHHVLLCHRPHHHRWRHRAAPRERAFQWAQTQAGTPYRYGSQGSGGYDCSGLVRTAYRHAGIWLPRTTGEMLQYWKLDPESSPRQGDLVFFGTEHVELYAGHDRSFGAETNRVGTWWNRWWPGSWWPTAFYRVTGAG